MLVSAGVNGDEVPDAQFDFFPAFTPASAETINAVAFGATMAKLGAFERRFGCDCLFVCSFAQPISIDVLNCSVVGASLAGSLPLFSLDLVGVVACYVAFGVASAGVKPVALFQFGDADDADWADGQISQSGIGGLAINPKDQSVWVGDRSKIIVFSPDGEFLRSFKPDATQFSLAFGHSEVFLSHFHDRKISVLDYNGQHLRTLVAAEPQLDEPYGMVINRQGELVVANRNGDFVLMCNPFSGDVIRRFGTRGKRPGQFRACRSIALHPSVDEMFISDVNNHRIQVCVSLLPLM